MQRATRSDTTAGPRHTSDAQRPPAELTPHQGRDADIRPVRHAYTTSRGLRYDRRTRDIPSTADLVARGASGLTRYQREHADIRPLRRACTTRRGLRYDRRTRDIPSTAELVAR